MSNTTRIVFIVGIDYQQFRESQGAFVPDPKVYWLLELSQRHIVTDADNTDTVAIDILQGTANGGGVLAVDESFLGLLKGLGDGHKKAVLESCVVGVEFNVDVHYDAENIRVLEQVNWYFSKRIPCSR